MKKIISGLFAGLLIFLGYVSTRNGHFHYERALVINAPAQVIYPFVSDFKKGMLWNPFDQKDPQMKHVYKGTDGQVGSVVEFEGNSEVGSGRLEILRLVPNELVEIKLTMIKPFAAENLVRYKLQPDGAGTRFTWSMEGDGGFMGKLVSVFMNCEKMITVEFDKGLAQLKGIFEK